MQDKEKGPDELRAAYAALLAAMCRAGGSFLWTAAGYYAEESLKLAVAGLTDEAVTVSSTREGGGLQGSLWSQQTVLASLLQIVDGQLCSNSSSRQQRVAAACNGGGLQVVALTAAPARGKRSSAGSGGSAVFAAHCTSQPKSRNSIAQQLLL